MERPDFVPVGGVWGILVDNTRVLESGLALAPTALERGLTPLELLHVGPPASLQQEIADLVAARDASDRYSAIQIMSSSELKSLVGRFAKGGKHCKLVF